LLTTHGDDPALQALLAQMKTASARPLGDYSCEGGPQCEGGAAAWPFYSTCNSTHCAGLLQRMKLIAPTKQYNSTPVASKGSGVMVSVPGSRPGVNFTFVSQGVEWHGRAGRGVGE
jgi:hypothetical protein